MPKRIKLLFLKATHTNNRSSEIKFKELRELFGSPESSLSILYIRHIILHIYFENHNTIITLLW